MVSFIDDSHPEEINPFKKFQPYLVKRQQMNKKQRSLDSRNTNLIEPKNVKTEKLYSPIYQIQMLTA